MILPSERIRLDSPASTDAVVGALRAASGESRESNLSASERAADILGWKVRVDDDRVVVRARIRGRNGSLPHFVGRLTATPGGAVLVGDLRLSWFSRVFMSIWLSLAAGAPVFALFAPYEGGVGAHLLSAFFMVVPAIALFSLGLWLTHRGWSAPALAFKDFLAQACNVMPGPVTSSRTRETSNERSS